MPDPKQTPTTVSQATNMLEAALAWYDAGCSIIPIAANGTKRPMIKWEDYIYDRPSRQQVERWFIQWPTCGIGIVCGKVSGNLEMLELEGRASGSEHLDKIVSALADAEISWLWGLFQENGYIEATPSGGIHFLYRISGETVPGNHKIASTAEGLCLSETRGQGGYVIVAPSNGAVHKTGDSWSVIAGSIGSIPTISWGDRSKLHEAIKLAINEELPRPEPVCRLPMSKPLPAGQISPGDDYNNRGSWDELLAKHGWKYVYSKGREDFWLHPNSASGADHSASVNDKGSDNLYVWSTSTPFESETPYHKWAALTILEFGGDFSASVKWLASQGYGTPLDTTNYSDVVLSSVAQAPVTKRVPSDKGLQPVQLDAEGLPVYPDSLLTKMDWHQIGIGRTYASVMENTFSYVSRQNQWMYWNQEKWVEENTGRPDDAAATMAERLYGHAKTVNATDPETGKRLLSSASKLTTKSAVSGFLSIAKNDRRLAAEEKDFNKDANLVTVGNGVYSLSTLQLSPFDPKLMLTRQIAANYQPDTAKGRWHQFMEEVLPNKEVRDYLQRACGYMLTGSLNERAMFLIHGESGTGKTQFLEAMGRVMGDFAGVAAPSAFGEKQQSNGPTDELHKLMGKRFVYQSELKDGSKLNESLVKSIVGGDTQTSRTLYGKNVDWRPEYTVFLATNYLPRISSSDNAIWNRVKPIKFEQVFVDSTGEALDPSAAKLGKKMAEECADEIFSWLIDGLIAYREQGLNEPAQVREWLNSYREDVDTVRQFLAEGPSEDRIEIAEGKQVRVRELYKAFLAFCTDNGITPLGSRSFTERMMSAGWKKEHKEKGTLWQGIGLGGFIVEAQTSARRW